MYSMSLIETRGLKEATVKNIRMMVDPEVQTDRVLFRTERGSMGR